jgi:hypothetical protein
MTETFRVLLNNSNKKFDEYLIREMKINSNNIAQPNNPSAINVFIRGNISTQNN